MARNKKVSDIVGGIFAIIFIAGLVIGGAYVSHKNKVIKRLNLSSNDKLERGDFSGSYDDLNEAIDQIKFPYSLFVGSKDFSTYRPDDLKHARGERGLMLISANMSDWKLDVKELMNQTHEDLSVGKSSSKQLNNLKLLQKLLPSMIAFNKNDIKTAVNGGLKFQTTLHKEKTISEFVARPFVSLSYELYKKTDSTLSIKFFSIASSLSQCFAKDGDKFFKNMLETLSKESPRKKVSKFDPQKAFKSALVLAKKKQFEKALPLLENCYSAESKNNKVCYMLALVKKRLGKKNEAKKLCEEILSRQPNSAKAKKLLDSFN